MSVITIGNKVEQEDKYGMERDIYTTQYNLEHNAI